MSAMSFVAGVICGLSCLILLWPWLRTVPRLGALPALPWQAGMGALVAIPAVLMLLRATGVPQNGGARVATDSGPAVALDQPAQPAQSAWTDVAAALQGNSSQDASSAPGATRAGSMDNAIAALQARLAKSGGSDDDWELLAKSYEFLGRPKEAAQARAHQLPAAAQAAAASGASPAQPGVEGEVSLASDLSGRAPAGTTLFIIAKSVDSPGVPVAVLRTNVGSWPLKFSLDDRQAMVPGRSLSSVGRVTIEARISKKGQPLAGPGDIQGESEAINPRDHKHVRILIDRVIS